MSVEEKSFKESLNVWASDFTISISTPAAEELTAFRLLTLSASEGWLDLKEKNATVATMAITISTAKAVMIFARRETLLEVEPEGDGSFGFNVVPLFYKE